MFSGDSGGPMDYNGGAPAELFRVYVATDEDCVNIVYRGAIVGSPAYAPRTDRAARSCRNGTLIGSRRLGGTPSTMASREKP